MKDTYLINNITHSINTFYSNNFPSGNKIRTQNQSYLSIKIEKPGFSLKYPKVFFVSAKIHSFDLWGELIIPLCRYFKTSYIWKSFGCLIQSLHKTEVNSYVFD